MSEDSTPAEKNSGAARLVHPGERLNVSTDIVPGHGIRQVGEDFVVMRMGTLRENGKTISVDPLSSRYVPRSGDLVVGYVEGMTNNIWFLDIGASFNAILPMSLAPWKVEFGAARQHLDFGDAVLARVMEVDETHSVVATMKGVGLRKIKQGCIEQVAPHVLSLVIGSKGRTLQRIKESSDCRIVAAQNGRILIDGTPEGISIARSALKIISETGHAPGLHDRLSEVLGGDE